MKISPAGSYPRSTQLWRAVSAMVTCMFLVGLIGSPAMAAPVRNQLPDSVVIPPGGPIELAVATWYDWDESPSVVNAVQMALDDFGPVKGFGLHATLYDAGCSIDSGAAAATAIATNSQNVGAIGFICSNSVEGGTPILETSGQVMLTPSATRPGLGLYGPNVFNRVVLADPAFEEWDAKVSFLPAVLQWARGFRSRYGDDPTQSAKYAYDAAMLLLGHIDGVSIVDGNGNLIIDRAALASAVRNTTAFPGVTDIIALDAAGDRVNLLAAVGTRYASTGGLDPGNDCTDLNAPCRTVQRGVALADEGGDVLVSGGAYAENVVVARQVAISGGFDPSTWTRNLDLYPTTIDGSGSQPVPGDWDGSQVRKAAVIRDNTLFRMWYDGTNLLGEVQIGLASSANGTSWNKSAGNPVLAGTPGSWDEIAGERAPWIIKEGGIFKMWYESGEPRQLGYATSPNGINWTKHPANPILQPGPDGFDQAGVGHGTVLHEGIYKLWYLALGDQGPVIAYATSPNGIDWTKHGPVLAPESGSWDESVVWGPSVLRYNGLYWMWYAGAGPAWTPSIGLARSADGVNWTPVGTGPVISEGMVIGDPHVILHGSILKMWYTNYEQNTIKYAESSDGIHWTLSTSNPVLTPGNPGQWGEPVIRFVPGSDGSVLDGLGISGGQGLEAGGVHAAEASITIKNCWIHDNFAGSRDAFGGGAVLGAFDEKPLTIEDSLIVHNSAFSGASGVRAHHGTLTMSNVALVRNHSSEAPAMHLNGVAALTNLTVADNDGGILHNPPDELLLTVRNSIVVDNGWAIEEGPLSLVQVRYSNIESGWPGTGNIDAEPLFRDPNQLDYHLNIGSPCIDTGLTAWAPDHDLDGDPRPLDGNGDGTATADMGVDEFVLLRSWLPKISAQ